ncbi:MAG: lysostaphin resistance A-like protein [Clostridium sp.]
MNLIKKSYIHKLSVGEIGIKKMGFWKAVGIELIFIILMGILGIIPNYVEVSIFGEGGNTWTWFGTIVNDIVIQFIIVTIIVKKMHVKENYNSEYAMNMGINKKDYIYCAGLIISFVMIRYGILDEVLNRLPYLISEEMIKIMESMFNNTSWAVLFVQTVIIASVFEEVIYRGIIFSGMLKKYSPKKAIIVSAFIFGLVHLNLPQGLNAFVLGILLATVYYYTRSLYICMFMHATNNFIVDFIIVPETFILKVAVYIIVPSLGIVLFLKLKDKLDFNNRLDNCTRPEVYLLSMDTE